jgi:polar amino acid transport system substrate-binding protein
MEPFFTSRRSSGGTGLGLYMSSKIISDHGGTIAFDSPPGEGTTVLLRLPAVDA